MKRAETFELLKPIVSTISNTVTMSSYIDNLNGTYVIYTDDTLWLTLGYTVTIGANEYTVKDIQCNEWVLLSGALPPLSTTFDIYNPFFVHGTILATDEELSLNIISKDKLPLIYLHEITREKFNNDPELSLDRESECDLYFLIDADFENWNTNDHYRYAIQPMRNLLFALVDAIEAHHTVGIFDSYEVFDHAKFGVYIASKGHVNKIFKDDLSGSQLRITIPFQKNTCCC